MFCCRTGRSAGLNGFYGREADVCRPFTAVSLQVCSCYLWQPAYSAPLECLGSEVCVYDVSRPLTSVVFAPCRRRRATDRSHLSWWWRMHLVSATVSHFHVTGLQTIITIAYHDFSPYLSEVQNLPSQQPLKCSSKTELFEPSGMLQSQKNNPWPFFTILSSFRKTP